MEKLLNRPRWLLINNFIDFKDSCTEILKRFPYFFCNLEKDFESYGQAVVI